LKTCYEAGPTGYLPYWQLTALGVAGEVIAPSLMPTNAEDWVRIDRRDAERLVIRTIAIFTSARLAA
jgi:hypothetical protein